MALVEQHRMAGSIDVLFVDEAGQIALANTLAISGSAASMVLLGNPQQLEQPIKGSHHPGAEASALQHLLGGDDHTIPGSSLACSWSGPGGSTQISARFTSEMFYDGRLHPVDRLGAAVSGEETASLSGTGHALDPGRA